MAVEDYFDFDDSFEDSRGYRWQSIPASPVPGAPNNGKSWTEAEERKLETLWKNHNSLQSCSEKMGRTKVAIEARLVKLGLDPNAQNESLAKGRMTEYHAKSKQGTRYMNMQHLIALLQEGYTTVEVKFFNMDTGNSQGSQAYTYKVPQALADTLNEGDLLVVPARSAFAVVKVHKVHDEPQIDVKNPLALRWVVQKVDTTAYEDQTAREAEAVELVEKADRRQAQEEALQTLLGSGGDREAFLQLINAK